MKKLLTTKAQRLKAYKKVLKDISVRGSEFIGICVMVHKALKLPQTKDTYFKMEEWAPELLAQRPKKVVWRALWWGPYNRKSRIKALEKAITIIETKAK